MEAIKRDNETLLRRLPDMENDPHLSRGFPRTVPRDEPGED
jgi:hypothetical protein